MIEGQLEFEEVHDTYRRRVHAYLARFVGESEADDLTQEVFARVSQSLKTFRGGSRLSTWIYRIAANAALDRLRKKGRSGEELSIDAAGDREDQNTWTGEMRRLDQQMIHREMNDCIRNVVSELPEKYRTILELSEFEGFRDDEIAGILSLSLESVKIRLHRGRAKLKEELSRRCILYRDERNEFACEPKNGFLMGQPTRV
jgi:RNA polymerase sigma-70 factor (ECF subfamily)